MTEEDEEGGTAEALTLGCGLWFAAVAMAVMTALAILGSGCRSYTVLAADREVVPVRQTAPDAAADRRTYVEADKDATGWYVPDSVMLELLDAD